MYWPIDWLTDLLIDLIDWLIDELTDVRDLLIIYCCQVIFVTNLFNQWNILKILILKSFTQASLYLYIY